MRRVAWAISGLLAAALIAAAATFAPEVAFVVVASVVLLGLLSFRLLRMTAKGEPSRINAGTTVESVARRAWPIALMPLVLSTGILESRLPVVLLALIAVGAFAVRPRYQGQLSAGPILLLLVASALVMSRPTDIWQLATFVLALVVMLRVIRTFPRASVVSSLVDGIGLLLVANVAAYVAGFHTDVQDGRIGGLIEASGFERAFFPLSPSLNLAPTIAMIFLVGLVFLVTEESWLRRAFRLVAALAAIYILVSTGTRGPLALAVLIPVVAILVPRTVQRLVPVAAILTSVSALVLPWTLSALSSVAAPLAEIGGVRTVSDSPLGQLNGRQYIWSQSIDYWLHGDHDAAAKIFGYGVGGQFTSGASLSYQELLVGVAQRPELATSHNSLLQQLFDGGVVGWLCLSVAMIWTAIRLARTWHGGEAHGLAGALMLLAVMLSSMTESSMAPAYLSHTFYILLILVGVASQSSTASSRELLRPIGTRLAADRHGAATLR